MKALSIRQPWAWLIVHGGKDIENRSWHTKYRGRFLVHAAKGMTREEYTTAYQYALERGITDMPRFADLERGGIIGSVELVDSLDRSDSPWYMGQKGYLLRDPQYLPFIPYPGQLQFFEVPNHLLPQGTANV